MLIEDGTGTGNKVEVDSSHRLRARTVRSTYHQYVSCDHEQAYMASLGTEAKPTLTVTGTGGYMMFLKNTSSLYDAIMARITISTSARMEIVIMKNPTIGSLGNEVAVTPANKNFKSGKVADVDVYAWDEVGDGITGITGGTLVGTCQVNGLERVLFDESVCLGLNDILAFKAKNAGEIAATLHGYYIIPE
jgi:hypothetical protein